MSPDLSTSLVQTSISGQLVGRDAWVPGSPPTHPTGPPSPGYIYTPWVHPHSNSYLLHTTVHEGALAWPGGPVHHDALSELRLLVLTHVVRAVQGVQEPCGWVGGQSGEVQKHMGVWQGPWSKVQLCHSCLLPPGLLCLGLLSQLSSDFSGSGNVHGKWGSDPPKPYLQTADPGAWERRPSLGT